MCPKNQYKNIHHLFWLLLWHLELHKTFDLPHLQVFLAQLVLQLQCSNRPRLRQTMKSVWHELVP